MMPVHRRLRATTCQLLFWCLTLSAQPSTANTQLVDQLQQAYADVTYFEAAFTQEKNIKFLSQPLVSKGRIVFAKNHGMVWEVIDPIYVKTIIKQQGIFKSNQFHENRPVKDVQMKAVADILTELLSSQLDRIESQFNVSEVVIDDDQHEWQVTLTAQSRIIKKALKQLRIEGNMGNDHKGIGKITILDATENTTVIAFNQVKLMTAPPSQDQLDDFQ